IRHIRTTNPVRPSERCGVSTAENNVGSSRVALSAAMAVLYTDNMAKRITRRNRAPARRKRAAPRKARAAKKATRPTKTARVRRPPKAAMAAVAAGKTMSAWTADEVETAFRRFAAANPDPRGELKHVDPYTLLVAVVLSAQATDEPTIAVDTHIFRVGNRTGLAPGLTPFEVEVKLNQVVPDHYKIHAHHWLILHGRYICKATKPACDRCIIAHLCKWPEKTADAPPPGTAG